MNGDREGGEVETRTGVDANEGTQSGNEEWSREVAGWGTGTGVETRGRIQDGTGDGSGDGNESSSEDGNGNEDGNGDGNKDRTGEDGETKKRKKPHKSCRRDQALSFRMCHHLYRQGVALAETRQLRL